jgi:hypothetical protein
MKQRVLVALLTVLIFGAGFASRMWTESAKAVPAPPRLGGEFAAARPPGAVEAKKPIDRAELVTEIERWKAQSEAYRTQMAALDSEFDRDFTALLHADQKDQYLIAQRKRAEKAAEREAKVASGSASDDDIDRMKQMPLYGAVYTVSVAARLDRLVKDYKLDAEQQAKTKELLARRRDKFIALLDTSPPPSIWLSGLAPLVSKIPPKKDE